MKAAGEDIGKTWPPGAWSGEDLQVFTATPAAQPGDCWRIHWNTSGGPVAGYGICCPKCKRVHAWATARNCAARAQGKRCAHEGVSSCWSWSGSAEAGTLTASPSLHCVASLGGCGWHGWLRNGELTGA